MELYTLGIRIIFPGRENATREFASVIPANKKKMSGIKNFCLGGKKIKIEKILKEGTKGKKIKIKNTTENKNILFNLVFSKRKKTI